MRRKVIEVYSLVGASGCEYDFLGLLWDWCGGLRDSEAADGRLVGIEEECVGELGFAIRRYSCCDAVEDSVVGPRDDLDCGTFGGYSWRSRFGFLARHCSSSSSRLTIKVTLSFCHIVVSWKFCDGVEERVWISRFASTFSARIRLLAWRRLVSLNSRHLRDRIPSPSIDLR